MTRSHVVPQTLGGFVWAWTHCAECNNDLGSRVESGVKDDDSIRYALEHALATVIPSVAQRFAEGQSYVARTDTGSIPARVRGGEFELGTVKLEDGSLVQDQERAKRTIEMMLLRQGSTDAERAAALDRFDAAAPGEVTPLTDTLSVRHGPIERVDLPFDGELVTDLFPVALAFHFLAFVLGDLIYDDRLDATRDLLRRGGEPQSASLAIERLLDRSTGYVPQHILGVSQALPHLVLRVQIFGPLVWRVHLLGFGSRTIQPVGVMLDVQKHEVVPAAPRRVVPIPPPAQQ